MQNAVAEDEARSFPRKCRWCKTPVLGMRIGKPPMCSRCHDVNAACKARELRARASHSRDEAAAVAHRAVTDAIRRGDLPKAADVPCAKAGHRSGCNGRHEWHHGDFGAPLDVVCLCKYHHAQWHSENVASRGPMVKCRKYGCRAEAAGVPSGWRCPDHDLPVPLLMWHTGRVGNWYVNSFHGNAEVYTLQGRVFVTTAGNDRARVEVHTPEDLRAEMRRVYTLVTGLEVA